LILLADEMLVDLPPAPAYPVPMTPPKDPIAFIAPPAAQAPAPVASTLSKTNKANEELLAIADNRIDECKARISSTV